MSYVQNKYEKDKANSHMHIHHLIIVTIQSFCISIIQSFNHLFNESIYRLVPIKSQYEKAKYKTNRHTHRETPKVRGSPQTRGYVHQTISSIILSRKLVTIRNNSVACTTLVYTLTSSSGNVQRTAFFKT